MLTVKKKDEIKNIIENSTKKGLWDFGNKVLYDLCKNNFKHVENDKIIAKVWLIGRSYSAAIERRKNKTKDEQNDDFYTKIVAPKIKNSRLDTLLSNIKKHNEITEFNTIDILKTHQYLIELIKKITNQEKRSFVSKYLHFHLPNLFYIFDSRAQKGLSKCNIRLKPDEYKKIRNLDIDNEYGIFFYKCNVLKIKLNNLYNVDLSNREIDKILIELSDKSNFKI